mgnify:CR=1 FL=1
MDRTLAPLSRDRGRAGYVSGVGWTSHRDTDPEAIRTAAHRTLADAIDPATVAFDHWHRGNRRLEAMERWMNQHGGDLTESEWTERLSRVETFREAVAKRYSDWMTAAIKVAEMYGRMNKHLDRERVERMHRLDFLTPGTNPSAIRRQWRHYLADDYESPPF